MLDSNIIWRSIKLAQIPVSKEPAGLPKMNGTRPDRFTLVTLAWDVTVPNTFADSHLKDTSVIAGATANCAAELKCTKYTDITLTHIFAPIAIETSGSWNEKTSETIKKTDRQRTKATNDPYETLYLFQRLSVAILRSNAVSFLNTFSEEREHHLDQ